MSEIESESQQEDTPLSVLARAVLTCVSLLSATATFLLVQRDFDTIVAAGFLAVFTIHEFGHIAVASYYGIPSTWPIFIPNVGAFVLTLRPFKDSSEEAYIALGGPVAGLLATAVLHAIGVWRDSPPLLHLAIFCYGLHLVNMIPAGMLDGGRIANHVFKPLWVPGLFALLWVAYEFSSDGWDEMLVAVLVLWPATEKALAVLKGQHVQNVGESSPRHPSDVCRVAIIAAGVAVLGAIGMWAARIHHHDLTTGCRLRAVFNAPPAINFATASGDDDTFSD